MVGDEEKQRQAAGHNRVELHPATTGDGNTALPVIEALAAGGERVDIHGNTIVDLEHETVTQTEVIVSGHRVIIYSAQEGTLISPNRLFGEARGSQTYTHFVYFDTVFADNHMDNSTVPEEQRWTRENTPEDIEVIDYDDGEDTPISEAALNIENIEKEYGLNAFLDPIICQQYQEWDEQIAQYQLPTDENGVTTTEGYKGLGVVRAGVPAVEAAGFDLADMILVNAKRHPHKEYPNRIGVGLSITPEVMTEVKANKLYVRERAIASGSSLMSLLLVLEANDALPTDTVLAGAVGSQLGTEQILNVVRAIQAKDKELARPEHRMVIKIGRLCYILTGEEHSYYLVSPRGFFSVSDGGDYADLLLRERPGLHRSVWPESFTEGKIDQLCQEFGEDVVGDVVAGDRLSLSVGVQIQKRVLAKYGEAKRWRFGEIMTDKRYEMTSHYQKTA